MAGHAVARSDVKNTALFDKYQCPYCSHLLKKAVQLACGHWLCESCADELLLSPLPKCPRPDCQEDLKADPEEGAEYFPDRFVRREIEGLIVTCPYRQAGCDWEDRLGKLEDHLRACKFVSSECLDCGAILTLDQMGSHKRVCPKAMIKCPLADFGCSVKKPMLLGDLRKHVNDHGVEHLQQIAEVLHLLRGKRTPLTTTVNTSDLDDETNTTGQNFQSFAGRSGDDMETDHAGSKRTWDESVSLHQSPIEVASVHPAQKQIPGHLVLGTGISDSETGALQQISLQNNAKKLAAENREDKFEIEHLQEEKEFQAKRKERLERL